MAATSRTRSSRSRSAACLAARSVAAVRSSQPNRLSRAARSRRSPRTSWAQRLLLAGGTRERSPQCPDLFHRTGQLVALGEGLGQLGRFVTASGSHFGLPEVPVSGHEASRGWRRCPARVAGPSAGPAGPTRVGSTTFTPAAGPRSCRYRSMGLRSASLLWLSSRMCSACPLSRTSGWPSFRRASMMLAMVGG